MTHAGKHTHRYTTQWVKSQRHASGCDTRNGHWEPTEDEHPSTPRCVYTRQIRAHTWDDQQGAAIKSSLLVPHHSGKTEIWDCQKAPDTHHLQHHFSKAGSMGRDSVARRNDPYPYPYLYPSIHSLATRHTHTQMRTHTYTTQWVNSQESRVKSQEESIWEDWLEEREREREREYRNYVYVCIYL